MTNAVYEELKSKVDEKFMLDVRSQITGHMGADNAITKEDISVNLFGKYNSSRDREIRDAVLLLVAVWDEHIVTNTTTGGFYYAANEDEIDQNIADMESRKNKLDARIEGLRRARVREFYKNYRADVSAQGRLF